jgi:hypothetical protein
LNAVEARWIVLALAALGEEGEGMNEEMRGRWRRCGLLWEFVW